MWLSQVERDAAVADRLDALQAHTAARRAVEQNLRAAVAEAAENNAAISSAEERWAAARRLFPSPQA